MVMKNSSGAEFYEKVLNAFERQDGQVKQDLEQLLNQESEAFEKEAKAAANESAKVC